MFCQNCGCQVNSGNFCPACGVRLDKNFIPRGQQNVNYQQFNQTFAQTPPPSQRVVLPPVLQGLRGKIIATNVLWLIVASVQLTISLVLSGAIISGNASGNVIFSFCLITFLGVINLIGAIGDLKNIKLMYSNPTTFASKFTLGGGAIGVAIYNTVVIINGMINGNGLTVFMGIITAVAVIMDVFAVRLYVKKHSWEISQLGNENAN